MTSPKDQIKDKPKRINPNMEQQKDQSSHAPKDKFGQKQNIKSDNTKINLGNKQINPDENRSIPTKQDQFGRITNQCR